jgi:hypothetical protein
MAEAMTSRPSSTTSPLTAFAWRADQVAARSRSARALSS